MAAASPPPPPPTLLAPRPAAAAISSAILPLFRALNVGEGRLRGVVKGLLARRQRLVPLRLCARRGSGEFILRPLLLLELILSGGGQRGRAWREEGGSPYRRHIFSPCRHHDARSLFGHQQRPLCCRCYGQRAFPHAPCAHCRHTGVRAGGLLCCCSESSLSSAGGTDCRGRGRRGVGRYVRV